MIAETGQGVFQGLDLGKADRLRHRIRDNARGVVGGVWTVQDGPSKVGMFWVVGAVDGEEKPAHVGFVGARFGVRDPQVRSSCLLLVDEFVAAQHHLVVDYSLRL